MLRKQVVFAASIMSMLCSAAYAQPAPSTARESYFPPSFAMVDPKCLNVETGEPAPVLTDLENQWYSTQLSAAGEPSLYLRLTRRTVRDGPTLRFTWLRSFHAPMVIRIERLASDQPKMIAKKMSGKGGYAPGTVSELLERRLSHQEQKALLQALQTTDVLSMSPKACYRGSTGMRVIQLDGSEWIIEAIDSKGYHFVNRWTPQNGGVHDLGLALLRLTGWDLRPMY